MTPEFEIRSIPARFEAREDGNGPVIEGYFAVFGDTYRLWDDFTESISPEAFNEALGDDIRALINHDTTLVLGRTAAHTLELNVDSHGLFGRVRINPKDSDAMNCYARVERGDVTQCSFGFDILEQKTDFLSDGSVHRTILKVKLYEVSVCTFPAYEATGVTARSREELENVRREAVHNWAESMLARLKGEN